MASCLGECKGFHDQPTLIPTPLLDFAKFNLHYRQVIEEILQSLSDFMEDSKYTCQILIDFSSSRGRSEWPPTPTFQRYIDDTDSETIETMYREEIVVSKDCAYYLLTYENR